MKQRINLTNIDGVNQGEYIITDGKTHTLYSKWARGGSQGISTQQLEALKRDHAKQEAKKMTTKAHRDKIMASGRIPQQMTIAEAAAALLIIREELYDNKLRATPLQISQITDIAWALSTPGARDRWEVTAEKAVDDMVSSYAAELGRKGGKAKSEAKVSASRANGRKE